MSCLVVGALSFDFLLHVDGRFDKGISGVSAGFKTRFVAPRLHLNFGGCGGNIAYALNCLGNPVALMGTVGEDFATYHEHLCKCGIDDKYVEVLPGENTARAFMISDEAHSQIVAFYPGASGLAHQQSYTSVSETPEWAIVAPNGSDAMLHFSREFVKHEVPFIFDPGPGVHWCSEMELREMTSYCTCLICNHSEYDAFCRTAGKPKMQDRPLIITHGKDGSEVFVAGKQYTTPAAVFGEIVDTTGCGDAYRAALIHGLRKKWDWQKTIHLASAVAGISALHPGGQGYMLSEKYAIDKCVEYYGDESGF